MATEPPAPEGMLTRDGDRVRGPGLIDLQVNGYAGVDFNGPPTSLTRDALHHAAESMRRRGVVGCAITLITDEHAAMAARARRLADLLDADAALAGCYVALHVEGPFISPEDGPRGAHPREHTTTPADAPDLLPQLRDAGRGRVRIVTLAPELPGATEAIRWLADQGIVPAIGHTAATVAQLDAAVRAGARFSTHLGNGSHDLLPRLDNYVQAQLADDRLAASFIADGVHMPLFTLRNFLRAKGPALSILVTDAVAAADAPAGRYAIGSVAVESDGRRVQRADGTSLAGSSLTLDRAVLNAYRHASLLLEQAWAMASRNPARLLGLADPPPVTVRVGEESFERVEPPRR